MPLTDEEFAARRREVLIEERSRPSEWWYCSFASEETGKFLGACIIRGHGIADCSMAAHAMGINPGGQMLAGPWPEAERVPDEYRNRLLDEADFKAIDAMFPVKVGGE